MSLRGAPLSLAQAFTPGKENPTVFLQPPSGGFGFGSGSISPLKGATHRIDPVPRRKRLGYGKTKLPRRHTPIIGITTARSEKWFKQKSNQVLRQKQKKAMQDDPDAAVLPVRSREAVETWSGPKDGKLRFNPRKHPRLLRK